MSAHQMYVELYQDARRELTHQQELVTYYRMRLAQCEGQRFSLLGQLRSWARTFDDMHFPVCAADIRASIANMETDYANLQPVKPLGTTGGESQPDPGSAQPDPALQMGSQDGAKENYLSLPREERLARWDEVKS